MSRIYFHSPEDDAEVRGSERAYMGASIADWFVSTLEIPSYFQKNSPFFNFIPQSSYLQEEIKTIDAYKWSRFVESLKTWIRVGASDNFFVVGNYKVDLFGAQLNTAYLMGSDPVKLMARLYGQCEVHCYVEGRNREWLAQIIEQGLNTAIYRRGQEWESAIALLRNGHDSPVVMSYSVCEQFPNAHIAGFNPSLDEDGEQNWDEWYDLDSVEQWRMGMDKLRRSPSRALELSPETWNRFYFTHGWDAFKFNHLLHVEHSRWNTIAEAFSEARLPAADAWTLAVGE